MVSGRRHLPATAATVFAVLAVPAVAQDPGVRVDPDSPAGKEYAIPLEAARSAGQGTNSRRAPGAVPTPAPLFGEGVESPARERRRGSRDRDTGKEAKARSSDDRFVDAFIAERAPGGSGPSGLLVGLLAGGGVLAIGGAFAWGARALSRRPGVDSRP